MIKYGLLLFFVILYANKGFINHVYIGEQSVYCQLCYHLEMEQEFLKIETAMHFNDLSILTNTVRKEKEGSLEYIRQLSNINSNSPKVLKLRSKIYDSLRKYYDISMAMKHSNCNDIFRKYNKNYNEFQSSKNLKTLCKYIEMSLSNKIIYHLKSIVKKIQKTF